MPVVQLADVAIYYEPHGPEEAPPLLLLHGATGTFRSGWRKQVEPFSQAYRVIGPDLRGHGRSTNPANRLDLRQMADDMHDLLDHLGYESAHVCGFSGGASTALFLAVRHLPSVRSLVLVSNNFELDRVRAARNFWDPTRVQREQPQWWARMERLHPDVRVLLHWWAEEDKVRPDFHASELEQLDVPVLLLNGDRDEIIPLEQTYKLYHILPNAQLGIIPGTGHGIQVHRPDIFNHLVLDFLSEQEPSIVY